MIWTPGPPSRPSEDAVAAGSFQLYPLTPPAAVSRRFLRNNYGSTQKTMAFPMQHVLSHVFLDDGGDSNLLELTKFQVVFECDCGRMP